MGLSNEMDDEMDSDPLNLFPGIPTKQAGPFGVPVPTPLAGANVEPPAEEADTNRDQPSPTTDEPGPTTTNRDESDVADADAGSTTTDPDEPAEGSLAELRRAVEHGENYIDRVETAMDEETCQLCAQILDNLRTRPLEEQVQGVKELAELKQAAQRGADPVELAEVMEDFEVVDDPSQML